MKQVTTIEFESISGHRFATPKGALIDDLESLALEMILDAFEGGVVDEHTRVILTNFLRAAAAHPARFARRVRRLHKMWRAVLDYEHAEAKKPDAIPF